MGRFAVFVAWVLLCSWVAAEGAFTATTSNPRKQPNAILGADGNSVFRPDGSVVPVFQPNQKNVLIIHGWNGSPSDACMKILIGFADGLYDNVLAYQYPSAEAIGENARWLYNTLSPLMMNPDLKFDIIAYSEGGLVARAA